MIRLIERAEQYLELSTLEPLHDIAMISVVVATEMLRRQPHVNGRYRRIGQLVVSIAYHQPFSAADAIGPGALRYRAPHDLDGAARGLTGAKRSHQPAHTGIAPGKLADSWDVGVGVADVHENLLSPIESDELCGAINDIACFRRSEPNSNYIEPLFGYGLANDRARRVSGHFINAFESILNLVVRAATSRRDCFQYGDWRRDAHYDLPAVTKSCLGS